MALVCPSDMGNLGTILRTLLGFGIRDLALVGNGADVWNPKVVRASMGALFRMEVESFPEFSDYLNRFGEGRSLYPFMLDGGTVLTPESCPRADRYTLIFSATRPPAFPGIPELRSEPVYRPDRRGGFPEPGGVRGHRQLSVYRKTAGRGRQNPSDLGRERESVQVAVLSDIHSNYRALEAVLAECEKRQIKITCFWGIMSLTARIREKPWSC